MISGVIVVVVKIVEDGVDVEMKLVMEAIVEEVTLVDKVVFVGLMIVVEVVGIVEVVVVVVAVGDKFEDLVISGSSLINILIVVDAISSP